MDGRKRVRVDLEELGTALEDSSYEHRYYLDLETGEIPLLSDYMDTDEAQKLEDRLEEEPDRYEAVPKTGSDEAYRDMEEFIGTVEDGHLRQLLEVAIDGRGAFRRFKDVLAGFAEEREEWFHFKEERLMERTREWLEDIGVEPVPAGQ